VVAVTFPLTADLIVALREHRAEQARQRLAAGPAYEDQDLVIANELGAPVDPDSLTHAFGKIAKRVGLDGVRLHDLRHFVATGLAASGLGAHETSKTLGHASVAFTLNTYTHPDQASFERTRDAFEGMS
jgi:integrase